MKNKRNFFADKDRSKATVTQSVTQSLPLTLLAILPRSFASRYRLSPMRKKGYAYFVELALAIMLIFIILSSYFESEQTVFNYKQNEDSRISGWYLLKTFDDFSAIDSTNFTKINAYVDAGLDDFTDFDLEYYNNSNCFPVDEGAISSTNYTRCPAINATIKTNIISTFYTRAQNNESESIRLYLWRRI